MRIDCERYKREFQATITGPWNCVVNRDIHLLKAHSCSSSNCVGNVHLVVVVLCYLSYIIHLHQASSAIMSILSF